MTTKTIELWTNIAGAQNSNPLAIVERAAQVEADGWDGATIVDTECIAVETYVTLALCAQRTSTLKLAPGVTNPVTRHPAVTAAAIATLQLASGGRAELGVGRGDSSLAYLGASPMPIGRFEQVLSMLQAYLRGEEVPLADAAALLPATNAGYEKLALGEAPPASWLKWLPKDAPKVPLDVVATGPKAIGIAARVADRVSFVVGANVERLKWGMETARRAAEEAGRDPATLKFSAWVLVYPHEQIEVARKMSLAAVSSMSRFLVMNQKVVGPASAAERATLERLGAAYDMKSHGQKGAQSDVLDPAFIDSYAIVGPTGGCLERIQEIAALGFDRLLLSTPLPMTDRARHSYGLVVSDILPALRK